MARAGWVGAGWRIGLGIVANLAFEKIGLDLFVVAALAVLTVLQYRRHGPQPLVIYYLTAYILGLAVTGIIKLLAQNRSAPRRVRG